MIYNQRYALVFAWEWFRQKFSSISSAAYAVLSAPDGSHVGPMNLAIKVFSFSRHYITNNHDDDYAMFSEDFTKEE